ncbi:hypothetical protein THOM_0635 [Trachipleistophora hominis]|uniref:Uncharacterized protein n=1 Tax=Trachipleistophora hominis TaxID=72359 RepID=L7JY65_TRAHO|nr:hypothetical protein THOM_0635 [Trachipleistophora hominis]
MDAEKDVNNKIKELLDYTNEYKNQEENKDLKHTKGTFEASTCDNINNNDQGTSEVQKLIEVLDRNEKLYSKINAYLNSSNHDKLQNELLKENINSSLVCESMMKVLREISAERNESVQNEKNTKMRVNELLKEQFDQKKKIVKLMDDLKYCSSANNELLRLVQDQKGRISAYKEKYELEKKNVLNMKVVNEELDSLRRKALTKIEVLTKEISVLSDRIKECNAQITALKQHEQQKEEIERSFESQVLEMERSLNEHKKVLEEKGKALEMCNSELAKLLAMEKRMKEEIKNLKEKSSYYERLYRSINEQNEYLNAQLTKFINNSEMDAFDRSDETLHSFGVDEKKKMATQDRDNGVGRDRTVNNEQFRGRLRKYKKKMRKYKKLFNVQNEQIAALKNNLSRADEQFHELQSEFLDLRRFNDENVGRKKSVTDDLLSKMKELMDRNLEYQNKIIQLESRRSRRKEDEKWFNVEKKLSDANLESINHRNRRVNDDEWMIGRGSNVKEGRNLKEVSDGEFKDFTESSPHISKPVMKEQFKSAIESSQYTAKPETKDSFKDEWKRFFDEAERQRNMRVEDDARDIPHKTTFYDAEGEADGTTIYTKNKNAVESIWNKITTTFKPNTRTNTETVQEKMEKLKMSTNEKRQEEFFDAPSRNETVSNEENVNDDQKGGKGGEQPENVYKHEEELKWADARDDMNYASQKVRGTPQNLVSPLIEKRSSDLVRADVNNTIVKPEKDDANKINKTAAINKKSTEARPVVGEHKEASTDSDSTTDTFKKMREKTQKLQQKFSELEQKLNKIKGNNDPSSKKLHDQIEAYTNYYYTDFVDISNDSDFI